MLHVEFSDLFGDGRKVLKSTQFTHASKQWKKPDYPDFKPRNGWSLYNAVTSALKTSRPKDVIDNHVGLHQYIMECIHG